jgi:uncharacterized repeat protein (TIGR01451 family)
VKYIVCAFLAVIFSLPLTAQLDPRERYGTYFGGGVARTYNGNCSVPCNTDSPADTAVDRVVTDSSGNIYVAGHTTAIDLPTTSGAYRRSINYACQRSGDCISSDAFVAKFSSSGKLVWSTYLNIPGTIAYGSNVRVVGLGIDTSSNVAVVTNSLVDLCWNSTQILKLNSSGSAVIYSNALQCGDYDIGTIPHAAVIDASGRYYYLTVSDTEGYYPTTAGANPASAAYPYERLIKIDALKTTNSGIVYSAGSTIAFDGSDVFYNESKPAGGVVADGAGNAYVFSPDTRVSKFDSVGRLLFSVNYLPSWATAGGSKAITLTSSGDVLFSAPVSPQGAYPATSSFGTITTGSSATDAMVVRLNGTTGARVYSTAIHDAHMTPLAIARNSSNEAFVTGSNSGYQYSVNRYSNGPSKGAFVLRLNSTGNKVWLDSTFGGDAGWGIAVDSAWNALVVGTSLKGEYFPITTSPYPAYQSSFKNAASQGFVAKLIIEADAKMLIQGASPNPVTHGTNLTYTLAAYNNGPDVSDGDIITDVLPAGTTFVSYSTTNGTCTHPAVGYAGTFKCTRSTALNKGSYWGPVKLAVRVNAAAGTTLKNTASVAAKTQDVFSSNTATVYVKVQ